MKPINKLLATTLLASGVPTFALDFDFSGTFSRDNDIAQFNFTVGSDSTITIFSSSWDDGGFDPILAIWDAGTGNLIQQQDDGLNSGSTFSNGTSYDHGIWDSYYTQFLSAGNYIATVAQYNNFAAGGNLSNGFVHDGDPNFTSAFGSQTYFNGVFGSPNPDPRNGNYAFHILNVAEATHQPPPAVPEAGSTFAILSAALAGLGLLRRKT